VEIYNFQINMSISDVCLTYSPHEYTGSGARRAFYSMVARRLFVLMSTSHGGGQGSSSGHLGFVVDKVALGQVFSEYFGFHRLLPRSSSIIRGWYNRPISGRRTKWTQSRPTPRNKNTQEHRSPGVKLTYSPQSHAAIGFVELYLYFPRTPLMPNVASSE
jgi:hypothetical protein